MVRGLRRAVSSRGEFSGTATRIALSYSIFLLVCLALALVLYLSSVSNSRASYWQQRTAMLENTVTKMDDHLAVLEGYARQLSDDSTFFRLANMPDNNAPSFHYTAYTIMNNLSAVYFRYFSLSALPVEWCHTYLRNSEYILSTSEFGTADLYYRRYRTFAPGGYATWQALMTNVEGGSSTFSMTPYTGEAEAYAILWDMNTLSHRPVPATICFEWDVDKLKLALIPDDAPGARLTVTDATGRAALAFNAAGTDEPVQSLHATSGYNGWSYTLELPESMCTNALDTHSVLFIVLFCMAAFAGSALVVLMVRRSMLPIQQLSKSLSEARAGHESLEDDLERQRPLLYPAYTRRLLTGHVSSRDEFDHMLRFLGMEGAARYCVLYTVLYQSEQSSDDSRDLNSIVSEAIERRLHTDYPARCYTASERIYVALVAFGGDTPDPLMELQHKFLALHDELMEKHALWLLAGVGKPCEQVINVWESYEQARAASRYTARNHTFLPYEMIRKDSNAVYYPAEISVKLFHFITSGNTAQVVEMFALIRRENVEERTLPANLFDFLLSDLRNTLLKARFHLQSPSAEQEARLAALDVRFHEPLTFGQCERIALELCDIFDAPVPPENPIPAVEQFIRANYQNPSLCLNLLSDRFHLSESYLSYLFKERTGVNFSVYLEDLRLNEAVRLLQDENAVVTKVYLEVGYTNATTFRRAFKKKFGFTPSVLREQAS